MIYFLPTLPLTDHLSREDVFVNRMLEELRITKQEIRKLEICRRRAVVLEALILSYRKQK
jgi:hypothetical protein